MNPSEKGWLKEHLENRKGSFLHSTQDQIHIGQSPDQSFYGLIQPTGLMYGSPVNVMYHDQLNWKQTDKVKVILADSLINIAELFNNKEDTKEDYWGLMARIMDSVNKFYNGVYPEIATSSTNWIGKKLDVFSLTEKILEKRIDVTFRKSGYDFWTEFFYQTELFLDIYIFSQWTHTMPDQILIDFFKEEKIELSYASVKVMAAAAHANKLVETEERKLFQHFISGAGFPPEKKRVAQEYFDHGLGIQEIPIEKTDPWIIRKFFLELAILTVWSDKRVDNLEADFLSSFNHSLGFSEDDFDHSMIAVEGFVLQNWQELENLKDKKKFNEVSDEYIFRISRIIEKYKNRMIKGITDDQSLTRLLKHGSSHELTAEERLSIKDKLIDILKDIPSFRVIALPKDFFNYDILLQIIPRDVMSEVLKD